MSVITSGTGYLRFFSFDFTARLSRLLARSNVNVTRLQLGLCSNAFFCQTFLSASYLRSVVQLLYCRLYPFSALVRVIQSEISFSKFCDFLEQTSVLASVLLRNFLGISSYPLAHPLSACSAFERDTIPSGSSFAFGCDHQRLPPIPLLDPCHLTNPSISWFRNDEP